MPVPLDSLLAPFSADNPAGVDVSYDPAFQELDLMVAGKPETQFSAAEPADWMQVQKRCLELLGRSKHLRLGVTLGAALLRTEGLGGFRDALTWIETTVREHWEALYPRLDPDDYNDPTERLNILTSLTAAPGVQGDPYKIVEGLRAAPLSNSAQMGRFSLNDFQTAQANPAGTAAEGAKPTPTAALVEAAFRDSKPEHLQGLHTAVTEALARVKSLYTTLGEKTGDRAPNFDNLNAALREIQKLLGSQGGGATATAGAGKAGAGDSAGAPVAAEANVAVAVPARAGAIESREDVVKALDAIAGYYVRREPSSPVPLLLERAKRLVTLDFMAIMEDMAPDAISSVNVITGRKS